jgi:hypothetical protein
MTARTASRTGTAYDKQLARAFVKVKGASRGAWLASLGAIARVQTGGPRYFASLVRDGERFEVKARKSANEMVAAVRPYLGKLQRAYGEGVVAMRGRFARVQNGAAKAAAPATKRVRRTVRPATTRARRAAS